MSSSDDRREGRRFDSLEQEAFLNLWRTYDRLRLLEDALFVKYDLTAQQYNALRLLRARHPDPLPTLALAGRLISRAPDITRLLDRLEKRDLVRRTRRADNRRIVAVAITRGGLALLDELDPKVRQCNAEMLGHFSRPNLLKLITLLRNARSPHEVPERSWL